MAAEHRQPRFFLRRDDLQRDPGLAPHPVGEFLAVGGAAARLGGDRARQRDVAAAELVGAHRQRPDRAVHRRVGQAPRLRQTLAQPDDARESIDHGEAALDRASDQQPAIVGSKVERAIGVAHAPPPRGRDDIGRTPRLRGCRRDGDTLRHVFLSLVARGIARRLT